LEMSRRGATGTAALRMLACSSTTLNQMLVESVQRPRDHLSKPITRLITPLPSKKNKNAGRGSNIL
jgi:hypothetical protein